MTCPTKERLTSAPAGLLEELLKLRQEIVEKAEPIAEEFITGQNIDAEDEATLRNLANYLALRHHDIRPLQRKLTWRGLSSLGRLESRVLPNLDAVIAAVALMNGDTPPVAPPSEQAFFHGDATLEDATTGLLGPRRPHRRGRIMVTLPTEAADDAAFVLDLATRGMDVARINCAHDDRDVWLAIARNVRAAADQIGRPVTILMDVAGPKIRTEAVLPETKARLQVGDLLRLVASGVPRVTPEAPFSASVSLPEIVTNLAVGHRVRYDDGKLEGIVESIADQEALVRVRQTKTGGTKLKPEKGINLPDTDLHLSPLTAKDKLDLATVVECADMVGYSFISHPDDIDLLEEVLSTFKGRTSPLGLVAKIEQPQAVKNLPALIARAHHHHRPFGVMIARGDLAAEIGFERVAEMQEELLWICEAASVPTIWATQVLEDLVKNGLPSRGEMTDAAMAARAECVMLNKGPAVGEAVSTLDRLLSRMDDHVFKKTPRLRALKSW